MSDTASLSFGRWVKQRRKALDLTQEALAEQVGCSIWTIQKIETGERRPSRQVVSLLAECLRLPPEEYEAFTRMARVGAQTTSPPGHTPVVTEDRQSGQATQNNLPAPMTVLIGREKVVEEICKQLTQPDRRLLTLTGAPGIGKTRLAIEVGHRLLGDFSDGVFFVALAPLRSTTFVPAAIAQAVGLLDEGSRPLEERLAQHLRDNRSLLVLDNFEHLIEAVPLVVELLQRCPRLTALATSREALHVSGERRFIVPPLDLPVLGRLGDGGEAEDSPAVVLFVDRAQAVQPDFVLTPESRDAVSEICVRLDGLPLAIELAAARVEFFSPQNIRVKLGKPLALLTGGPQDLPARQQTLRAAIEWSYELLSAGEQKLMARLSVFAGGCALPAIETVCNPRGDLPFDVTEGLASLVRRSLLQQVQGPEGETRYTMLESIREFSSDKLQELEEDESTRYLHAEYYLALGEAAEPELRGSKQIEWLQRLEVEHGNFRAALQWSLEGAEASAGLDTADLPDGGSARGIICLRLAGALARFWYFRGHLSEGRDWLDKVLDVTGDLTPGGSDPALLASRAKALLGHAQLLYYQGDNLQARPLYKESLTLYEQVGDTWGVAEACNGLGITASMLGDLEAAQSFWEHSLTAFGEIDDKGGVARSLVNLGELARTRQDNPAARSYYEQSLVITRTYGPASTLGVALFNLGSIEIREGKYDRALALFRESLLAILGLDNISGVALCLSGMAAASVGKKEWERAGRLLGASGAMNESAGTPLDPPDQAQFDSSVASARAHLAEETWQRVWGEGHRMSAEQATAYALEE